MFTDLKEALELTATSTGQDTDAALVVAHHARDKDDLAGPLDALGLPCGEDDLVRLLPHLSTPTTDDPLTGDTMPTTSTTSSRRGRRPLRAQLTRVRDLVSPSARHAHHALGKAAW